MSKLRIIRVQINLLVDQEIRIRLALEITGSRREKSSHNHDGCQPWKCHYFPQARDPSTAVNVVGKREYRLCVTVDS